MKHIGQKGILIALFVLALTLAACGSKESNNGAGSDPKVAKKADQNQMNPQPREMLQQGGKLLFPMPYAHVVTKDGEVAL